MNFSSEQIESICDLEESDRDRKNNPDHLVNLWVPFKSDEPCRFIFRVLKIDGITSAPQSYIKLDGKKIHLPSEQCQVSGDSYVTRCGHTISRGDYQRSEEILGAKSRDRSAFKGLMTCCHSAYVQFLAQSGMGDYWEKKAIAGNVVTISYFDGFRKALTEWLESNPEVLSKIDYDPAKKSVYILADFNRYSWSFEARNTDLKHYIRPRFPTFDCDINTVICCEHDPELWEHAVSLLENE